MNRYLVTKRGDVATGIVVVREIQGVLRVLDDCATEFNILLR